MSGVTVAVSEGISRWLRRGRPGSGTPTQVADSKAVTGDHDEPATPEDDRPGAGRLRAVRGPVVGHEPPPRIRLCREWKGPTVADLLRDEYVARLPGQVRSALHHLERADLRAAEQALPGEFAPLLPGPAPSRTARRLAAAAVVIAAVLAAFALAAWMGA